LLRADHEVVAFDNRTVPDADARVIAGDIRDPALVAEAVRKADAVCHLAAKVGLGTGVHDIPDYAGVNVAGTAVLLAGMARAGVSRLVQASSMVVYGEGLGHCTEHGSVQPAVRDETDLRAGRFEPRCPRCGEPLTPMAVDETAPLAPRNAYAASKVAQEHFAASWARATGARCTSLRYHNVYGPGMPRDTPYAGVAAIFRSAVLRGAPPRVFEDGRQRRDFVHVHDVAAATVAALESDSHDPHALNVGSGTPRTVGDLAAAVSAALGGPPPVVTAEYRLGDVRHIIADSTLLRRALPWQPTKEFERGMAELVDASG
jgi:dTDP-L-rhamnose 4-epimerase